MCVGMCVYVGMCVCVCVCARARVCMRECVCACKNSGVATNCRPHKYSDVFLHYFGGWQVSFGESPNFVCLISRDQIFFCFGEMSPFGNLLET